MYAGSAPHWSHPHRVTNDTLMCICFSILITGFCKPMKMPIYIFDTYTSYLPCFLKLIWSIIAIYFFFVFFHLKNTLGTSALLFTDLLVTFCQTICCWTVTDCPILLVLRYPCAKWLCWQSSLFWDSQMIRFHSASIWYQSLLCEVSYG